jgi:cysteine-rich repeat protein
MRTLCLLLVLVAGCMIEDEDRRGGTHYCGDGAVDYPLETCDDGNALGGDGCSATCAKEELGYEGYITADWAIRSIATSSVMPCPSGYDTAAVYTQPVNSSGAPVGTPYVDLFNCIDFGGTIAPVPAGRYLSWVEITNNAGTLTYAKSLSAEVDTTAMDQVFSVSIYSDGGYFQLAWTLIGAQSNAPLTCAQAGASGGVQAMATLSNTAESVSDIWDCESGSGVTSGILQGSYTVSVSAQGSTGQNIGGAPQMMNKAILPKNQVTDLGTVQIPFTWI